MDTRHLIRDAELLEREQGVTIVHTELIGNINRLNEDVLDQLNKKKITLSKFWITDESIAKLNENKPVRKIYHQQKLKSSFLVTYMKKDNLIFVIGESISYSSETLAIVNRFNLYIYAGGLLLLIVLSLLFTKKHNAPFGFHIHKGQIVFRFSLPEALS